MPKVALLKHNFDTGISWAHFRMAGDQAVEQHQQTFKQQLDQVAEERRSGADKQQSNPIVEKSKHGSPCCLILSRAIS